MSKPVTVTLDDGSTITYHNPALVIEGMGDFGEPNVKIIGRPDKNGNVYSFKQPEKESRPILGAEDE